MSMAYNGAYIGVKYEAAHSNISAKQARLMKATYSGGGISEIAMLSAL